jgi:aryl-alcohol dehydrogenase-like predicted oxidoreductase
MAVGLGCMRLSTGPARDDARSRSLLIAAIAGGVELLDTAPSYALGEHELGHNERLIGSVLRDHPNVRVVTKAGVTRDGSAWRTDGRRKAIEASAEASAANLGRPIEVLLLHAVDPQVPIATSVRALEALRVAGVVSAIGICNVSRAQLIEALDHGELSYLQVAFSLHDRSAEGGGVIALARDRGLTVLAHTPLGGPSRAAKLTKDPVLGSIAASHGASAAQIAIASLLAEGVVPLVGAARMASLRELLTSASIVLSDDERGRIAARGRIEVSAVARAVEVVLLIGSQGSGKSSSLAALDEETVVLSRDAIGGTLSGLAKILANRLASPEPPRRIVLDNTHGTRAQRALFVSVASRAGAKVIARCHQAPPVVTQANVARRIVRTLGELPSPELLKRSKDPRIVPPQALFRYVRAFEAPAEDEGFDAIETVPFERRATGTTVGTAMSLTVLDRCELPTEGSLLIYGWAPDDDASLRASIGSKLGGREAEVALCLHGAGPPVCWCRPPLPGLVASWIERMDIDVSRSLLIGAGRIDHAIAEGCGLDYREP